MFTNKAFNMAFLASLMLHFFCMFAVNIVILPGRYRVRDLTTVSFLGPILEKTALEIILANKPVAVTMNYQRNLRYKHHIAEKGKLSFADNMKRHIGSDAEVNIGRAFKRVPRKYKEIPDIVTKTEDQYVYFKGLSEISGPASDREVIYKPEKPELPAWIDTSPPFKLEFEFTVSAQGEVKEVIPVISSGKAEVDLLGIRYLKSWRFAPFAQGLDEEEKGRVKFIFNETR